MATLNVQNLLVEINKKIVQTSDNEELLMLSKAVSVLKTGAIFTVGTFANLPDAGDNVGKLYFVENDGILYFGYVGLGNVEYWAPIITGLQVNSLWSWGYNRCGALGDGTTVSRCSQGTIAGGGTTWCQVAIANNSSAAIKTDGTLWTWGCNTLGQLGNGTTLNRCSPGTVADGGTNWCQVSGFTTVGAIKTDGTLWTWGQGNCGALGDGTTLARCSPGTVAGGGTNWCHVSSANYSLAAIKTDGTLWTWGRNCLGSLGDGTTVNKSSPGTVAGGGTNWRQVASVGRFHLAAIKTDGTLWTWGYNSFGQLGDGTVVNRSSPGTVAGGGTTWCQVSAGRNHTLAIKTDGTLWTWGSNLWNFGVCPGGQLGDGTTVSRQSPGTVAGGGTTWCQVSGGYSHTAAIKTDGTIWTWGAQTRFGTVFGSLGDGTSLNRSSPGTTFGSSTNWFMVCSASDTSFAIQRETL